MVMLGWHGNVLSTEREGTGQKLGEHKRGLKKELHDRILLVLVLCVRSFAMGLCLTVGEVLRGAGLRAESGGGDG